jgi:flagella basal body P-ring formation protein FlgA
MIERVRRRILRLFFISSFILCFPCLAGAADTLRITIPDAVRVEGGVCALSEVADMDGPRDLTERAGKLLLTIENGVITREQVIAALKVSGLEGVRIELKMPSSVKAAMDVVTPGLPRGRPVGENSRVSLAELIKNLAAWDGEVEAQHQGSVPEGRLVSPASIVPGTAAATLRFRDESGRERSLAVRLVWTQPALVLTRSLKRGEIVSEADLAVRQIRVSRPGVYASKVSEVAGRSLRKNLSQGEALPLNLVTDAPIIERGKSVTIVVKDGGLVVKAKGEAMENGALGDSIKVRNTASKTVLTAVVVAEDTVEVKMP